MSNGGGMVVWDMRMCCLGHGSCYRVDSTRTMVRTRLRHMCVPPPLPVQAPGLWPRAWQC